jgi:hypothetical protein
MVAVPTVFQFKEGTNARDDPVAFFREATRGAVLDVT